MTIKEIMEIGTSGMNTAQKQEEKERRIKVVDRINHIGLMVKVSEDKKQKSRYNRELRKIKADESEWLRNAAWFLYA